MVLSSHDMEIRGAGELLGDEQSGQIQEIGFTLSTELLERAVNAEELIRLIQTEAKCYKFDGVDKLRFIKPFEGIEQKLEFISALLRKLTP